MSYRYMRTLLFFDLPTITSTDKKNYRKFKKVLTKNGFMMLQESVYSKLSLSIQNADTTLKEIKQKLPSNGNIMILTVTEKQFSNMQILLGEMKTDVINTDERIISI